MSNNRIITIIRRISVFRFSQVTSVSVLKTKIQFRPEDFAWVKSGIRGQYNDRSGIFHCGRECGNAHTDGNDIADL